MTSKIESATYVRNYVIHLSFSDGNDGELDLEQELYGEIFEPLKDQDYFRQFKVDAELNTLVWPNGADFAPEFLYESILIATAG